MNRPRSGRANVFRHIGTIIFVSRIWGLVPRVARGGPAKKLFAFAYSSSMSLLYAYVIYAFNACAFARIAKAAANVKLLVKIIYVETTLRCFLLFAILVVNLAKSGDFLRILEKLADFDDLLTRKLRVDVPAARNVRFQIAYAVYIIFFGCYYWGQLYAAKNGIVLSAQWAALCNITLIILSQFTIFVHAFNVRFETFNTYFADMNVLARPRSAAESSAGRGRRESSGERDLPAGPSPYSLSFDNNDDGGGNDNNNNNNNGERWTTRMAYLNDASYRCNQERLNALRSRAFNVLTQFKLKELHVIYLSMRDLLREINSYYSFQVLLIVCETIAILIAGISTVTFNITGDDFSSKTFDRLSTLAHCGLRLLAVTVLIYAAKRTANQVRLRRFLLCKVPRG